MNRFYHITNREKLNLTKEEFLEEYLVGDDTFTTENDCSLLYSLSDKEISSLFQLIEDE